MQHSRVDRQSPLNKMRPANTQSASNLQTLQNKSKVILPSRFTQDKRFQKSGFHDILNQIQSSSKNDKFQVESSPKKIKALKTLESVADQKNNRKMQFKSKPMKREESDQQHFDEIFLNPRQQALAELQKSSKNQNLKTISKQYERLLKFQSGQVMKEIQKSIGQADMNQSYQQCIDMLDSGDLFGLQIKSSGYDFYEDPISIEPPDFPTGQAPSPISMSSGYAPSIPSNLKSVKSSNIKQLLMRAKAGSNTDDVEKEAHLAYFLGQLYSQGETKNYKQALKFFRRFLGFAKAMEDKIGMCLGANRVAVAYYHTGDIKKSILFHNENLKLSDAQNCFVGFYNLGICHRKQKKLQEALEYFESSLNWAQEKGEEQSECISYGQIGLTYQHMELYQESVENYEKSLQICNRIKKMELKLHNLRAILRVSSQFNLKPIQTLQQLSEEAYTCSRYLSNLNSTTGSNLNSSGFSSRVQDILRCNIGILKGMKNFMECKEQILQSGQNCEQYEEWEQCF